MYLGNGLIAPDVESTAFIGPPEAVLVTTPWPEPVETLPMPLPVELAPTGSKFPVLLAGLGLFALFGKPTKRRRRRK